MLSILIILLICAFAFAFYIWQKYKTKKQEQQSTAESNAKTNAYATTVGTAANIISPSQKVNKTKKTDTTEVKPAKEPITQQVNSATELLKNWVVVGASTIGISHLQSNPPTPCQDNHHYQTIGNGWGVAVSCDGAGSAVNSHFGSNFIAVEASNLFKHIVETNEWHKQQILPTQDKWQMLSKKAFAKLRYDLGEFAKENEFIVETLACTVIVVIYSPVGILVTHIGDGRAAFYGENQQWKAIIKPHKGEEANQTLFLTSQIGLGDEKDFVLNGIPVPESRVFNEIPRAFTLMSDGCENHSFELGYFDAEAQKYVEQNNPSPKFFNPLIDALKEMHQNNVSQDEIKTNWKKFVESGNTKLANEADDKTLILGVLIN